jgi:hypothetical protein
MSVILRSANVALVLANTIHKNDIKLQQILIQAAGVSEFVREKIG